MISLAIFLAGKNNADVIKMRVRQEKEFLMLLSHIKSAADSQKGDLCFAIETFDGNFLEKNGLLKALRQNVDKEKVLKNFKDKLFTDREETMLMCDFFQKIGRCRTSRECCELCEKHIELLKNHAEKNTAEEKSKAELMQKFSVLISAAVFVILI